MVSYVPIEEILILIVCFRESYEWNTQHKLEIGRSTCILSKNKLKLQPVPPPMPLEALLIPENLTDSDSNGTSGGTGYNFIFNSRRLYILRQPAKPYSHYLLSLILFLNIMQLLNIINIWIIPI